jgi:hypothetical protein
VCVLVCLWRGRAIFATRAAAVASRNCLLAGALARGAGFIFEDVRPEFRDLPSIAAHFADWRARFGAQYADA